MANYDDIRRYFKFSISIGNLVGMLHKLITFFWKVIYLVNTLLLELGMQVGTI